VNEVRDAVVRNTDARIATEDAASVFDIVMTAAAGVKRMTTQTPNQPVGHLHNVKVLQIKQTNVSPVGLHTILRYT